MPRPKGSKNKATIARQQRTAPAQSAPARETVTHRLPSDAVMDALTAYEEKMVNTGKAIIASLHTLQEEFDELRTSVSGKAASPSQSEKATGKKAPVVDEEDEEEDEDPDFDAMTVGELEDFIEKHDLDVDLDDYKTTSKKRQAVADAYDDLLDEEEASEDEEDEEEASEDEEDEEDEEEDDDDWDDPPAKASKPAAAKRGRR